MNILVIDDNGAILRSTKRALTGNKDVYFAECHSTKEAMKAIAESKPDVIMLDHELTENGNEGIEIADQLEGIEIYSTTSNSETVAEYTKRGIGHVGKSDLGKFIKELFER
jgi:CheY-like chemotaxis protein